MFLDERYALMRASLYPTMLRTVVWFALLAFLLQAHAFLVHPSFTLKEQNVRLAAAAKLPVKFHLHRNLDNGCLASRSSRLHMNLKSESGQPNVLISRNGEIDLATFPPHLQVPNMTQGDPNGIENFWFSLFDAGEIKCSQPSSRRW